MGVGGYLFCLRSLMFSVPRVLYYFLTFVIVGLSLLERNKLIKLKL